MNYSLEAIMHAFTIPIDCTFHIKKQIDFKHEKVYFYQNEPKMLEWIDERYKGRTTKLLQSYDITSFKKSHDRKVL